MRGWGIYFGGNVNKNNRTTWGYPRDDEFGDDYLALIYPKTSVAVDEGYGFSANRDQELDLLVDGGVRSLLKRGSVSFSLLSGEVIVAGWRSENSGLYEIDPYGWGDERELSDLRFVITNTTDDAVLIRKLSVEEIAT